MDLWSSNVHDGTLSLNNLWLPGPFWGQLSQISLLYQLNVKSHTDGAQKKWQIVLKTVTQLEMHQKQDPKRHREPTTLDSEVYREQEANNNTKLGYILETRRGSVPQYLCLLSLLISGMDAHRSPLFWLCLSLQCVCVCMQRRFACRGWQVSTGDRNKWDSYWFSLSAAVCASIEKVKMESCRCVHCG